MQIDKDVLRILNESNELTFADWFGQDLTGQTYEGDIDFSYKNVTSLKGAPKEVTGNFNCGSNCLTSLEGAPQKVGGNFDCTWNGLKSLEGAPQEVGGSFYCEYCYYLTDLKGAPQKVGNKFICSNCRSLTTLEDAPQIVGGEFSCCSCDSLTSLKGAPQEVGGDFDCRGCKSLTTLEGTPQEVGKGFYCCDCNSLTSLKGAPQNVGKGFYCNQCKSLTSLKGAPQIVGEDFDCYECKLTSLEGAPQKIGGNFDCSYNQITALKGAPQEVGGNFRCYKNQLTSLDGAPRIVGGNFDCSNNQITSYTDRPQIIKGEYKGDNNPVIPERTFADWFGQDLTGQTYTGNIISEFDTYITSLEGAPQIVNGDFILKYSRLQSLKYAPQIVNGNFSCYGSSRLLSLSGGPQKVTGSFDCSDCSLADLAGAPKYVGKNFDCEYNKFNADSLTLATQLPDTIGGTLTGIGNREPDVLKVLLAKNIKKVRMGTVFNREKLQNLLDTMTNKSFDFTFTQFIDDLGKYLKLNDKELKNYQVCCQYVTDNEIIVTLYGARIWREKLKFYKTYPYPGIVGTVGDLKFTPSKPLIISNLNEYQNALLTFVDALTRASRQFRQENSKYDFSDIDTGNYNPKKKLYQFEDDWGVAPWFAVLSK